MTNPQQSAATEGASGLAAGPPAEHPHPHHSNQGLTVDGAAELLLENQCDETDELFWPAADGC